MRKKRPNVREIAAAIMRRAPQGHVLMLSDPQTLEQSLHLMAARIDRWPIVILAPKHMDRPKPLTTTQRTGSR